jgi:hypothetical protein
MLRFLGSVVCRGGFSSVRPMAFNVRFSSNEHNEEIVNSTSVDNPTEPISLTESKSESLNPINLSSATTYDDAYFDSLSEVPFGAPFQPNPDILGMGLQAGLDGKGVTGKSVGQIMKELTQVRNRPIPALVIKAGLMDKTVTVAVQRWAQPHPVYRRHGGKRMAFTKLLVHDPGLLFSLSLL